MNKGRQRPEDSNIGSFDTFFLTWQPKLLYFIEHLMKDHEAARDMCQEIFLKAWDMRDVLADMRDPGSYLFKMAHNSVYNYFEHAKVSERYIAEALRSKETSYEAEEQLFAAQLRKMIEQTIAAMPEQRKRVWRMSRDEGLSNNEIAARLNISKRTVENHLSNALRQLRKNTDAIRMLLCILMT